MSDNEEEREYDEEEGVEDLEDVDFSAKDIDFGKKQKEIKVKEAKAKEEKEAVVVDLAKDLDEANLDDLFAATNKKKKKKVKKDEGEGGDGEGKKKKKKKEKEGDVNKEDDEEDCDYSYGELLNRLYEIMRSKNPDLAAGKRYKISPPSVFRVGTTRTCWANFAEICTTLKRNPEHVLQFFLAELGTDGSIDGSQRLVIKGRYVPRKIESLLRKYIGEYVTCHACRNPDTTLTRDAVSRLSFVHCSSCGSSRSVAAIKAGYHAVGRGERRKARNT